MMLEKLKELKVGEPITESWLASLTRVVNRLAETTLGHGANIYRAQFNSVGGESSLGEQQHYVEMIYDQLPPSDDLYEELPVDNATVLLWDEDEADYVADEGNEL